MKLFPTAKYVLGLVVAWLWREWNAPSLNFGAGNYETHWERDAEGGEFSQRSGFLCAVGCASRGREVGQVEKGVTSWRARAVASILSTAVSFIRAASSRGPCSGPAKSWPPLPISAL